VEIVYCDLYVFVKPVKLLRVLRINVIKVFSVIRISGELIFVILQAPFLKASKSSLLQTDSGAFRALFHFA
jgi:hypothetical protein